MTRSEHGRTIAAAVVLLSLGAACEEPSAAPPAPSGLAVELGELSADRSFTPYAPGTEESIIAGIQGGFHIFVDGRFLGGPAQDEYLVRLIVTLEDGTELTRIEHLRRTELSDTEDNPTLPEMIVFIPDPAAVANREVTVDLEVEGPAGAIEGDTVLLRLVDLGEGE